MHLLHCYSAFTETGPPRGHPDNENQSDDRTETIDSNIFKSSQSNVRFRTMKSQLVLCDAYATTVSLIGNKLSSSSVSTFVCLNFIESGAHDCMLQFLRGS